MSSGVPKILADFMISLSGTRQLERRAENRIGIELSKAFSPLCLRRLIQARAAVSRSTLTDDRISTRTQTSISTSACGPKLSRLFNVTFAGLLWRFCWTNPDSLRNSSRPISAAGGLVRGKETSRTERPCCCERIVQHLVPADPHPFRVRPAGI